MPDKQSTLQFVDLAGSERISKSMVIGDTLKETLHINKSLSALQDVISALESKSSHVPYRNSLLTRILKLSLATQESKVSIILNCSPSEDNFNETVSTLTLGLRLKSIDLSWAIRKNLKSEEVERTLSLLEKERSEKNSLSRKVEKLERDLDSYISAVKDKDFKINCLTSKLRSIDKSHAEEMDFLRKELNIAKIHYEDTVKKLNSLRRQIEQEKSSKSKLQSQQKSKDDQIKRVMSASPYIPKNCNKSCINPEVTTRIPRPGNHFYQSSKKNIILS